MNSTQADLTEMDLSLDVATLLRTGTSAAHQATENSEGAAWLTRGELDKNEYTRFLIVLWHVYSTLEDALERHATHAVLMPTYNPALLARAPALSADIAHLLSVPEADWKLHPLALSVSQAPPKQLDAYTHRIRTIASSSDPSRLLAHAYVRYLGDLSGGQIIGRRFRKAYHLDNSLGTQFYEFRKLGGGGVAGIGDMRTIKSWYREGMNKGVGGDEKRKADLVSEANTAFMLNADIFSTLSRPSRLDSLQSIVDVSSSVTTVPEHSVSIAGVISFMLAMGIAHFALVTGGFFGGSGLDKWDRAREWVWRSFGVA